MGAYKVTAGTVEKDTEVTITADLFGVTQDITFVVSNETAKVNPATVEVENADKLDADKEKDGIQIVLGADIKEGEKPAIQNGAITVTFTGVDQYGSDEVTFTPVANSKNATVATTDVSEDNKTVVITGVEAGETQIRVTVDAKEVALLDVKVTEENANVVAAKQLAEDKTAVAAAKAEVKDAYEVPFGTEADAQAKAVADLVKADVKTEGVEVSVEKTTEEDKFTVTLKKGKATDTKEVTVTVAPEDTETP